MADSMATVLRLVAEGRITPEEGTELLAALDEVGGAGDRATSARAGATAAGVGDDTPRPSPTGDTGRAVRVEVSEDGSVVVNLRLPASLGDLALRRIPGLSDDDTVRIRDALRRGLVGDILRVRDDAGNGVRISVE